VAGLDFHVFVTLLFRGWSVVAGAVTVLVVPIWLSPTEQGYYYTFTAILGLQIFFELGLSQVVIQLVGHETAHLTLTESQEFQGDAARIDRLASIAQLLQRWYAAAALLFAAIGGIAGGLFFMQRGQIAVGGWAGVWCLLVACAAVNLAYMPALALYEGSGRVGHVARLRLAQSAVGYGALWIALAAGLKLWAACIVPLVGALFTALWVRRFGQMHAWLIRRKFRPENAVAWRREVLPFQWRIALSWISGYFIFYSFTPLVFAHRGAIEAGRMGMALTVFNAVSTVGMSWVNAKSPTFAMHISLGERADLNSLFIGVFLRSLAFTTLASAAVVLGAALLTKLGIPQMARIAGTDVLISLALVCIANTAIFSMATYMRAHREEPMLPVSVVGGIATALVAWFGSLSSVLVMSILYAALTLFLSLPWSIALFMRYYRRPA
jgi:hypothetical protein